MCSLLIESEILPVESGILLSTSRILDSARISDQEKTNNDNAKNTFKSYYNAYISLNKILTILYSIVYSEYVAVFNGVILLYIYI